MLLVLQGSTDLVSIIAVVCSTWSLVNRHTSQRDDLTPEGQIRATSVRKGNRMVSRVSLLILLMGCLGQTYLLENPERSIITAYPRLTWVLKALRRAGVRVVWMIWVATLYLILLLIDQNDQALSWKAFVDVVKFSQCFQVDL